MSNTDPLSSLQADYTKYYKSKGCKTVRFYFKDAHLGDTGRALRELGVGDGDVIYAMENGKAY